MFKSRVSKLEDEIRKLKERLQVLERSRMPEYDEKASYAELIDEWINGGKDEQ